MSNLVSNNLVLPLEQWLEMQCDLTVILAEEYGDGGLVSYLDGNGDEYYTEQSQERFNIYNDEAESIMSRLGFTQGEL
tara:strand:+ start:237 stop:470 length:234 start_codon:yes stop_codon:yes gene_type:complete